MAKKTRPSFSAPPPKAGQDTAWVYRTDGAVPPAARAVKPSPAAKAAKPARPAAPATPRKPARAAKAAVPARAAKSATPVRPMPPAESAHARAREIVRRYATGSAAASLIPIPLVDVAAVIGVQGLMVRALARHYGVTFSDAAARAAIGAAAGGTAARWFGRRAARSWLKALPGVGHVAALAAMPASTSASTYLLGRIFIAHFEAGGGLHDLDTEAAAKHARAVKASAA